MKNYLLLCVGLLCFSFTGCASFWNSVDSGKSVFGSYRGDYVVVNATGGLIADVWVMENVLVESEDGSDGWRFKDNDNNMIHIGGDSKVMRIDNPATLRRYREYHMEFETKTYQELYGHLKVAARYHVRSRTNNFFDRGTQVAARYHQRGRTNGFFRRARGRRVC